MVYGHFTTDWLKCYDGEYINHTIFEVSLQELHSHGFKNGVDFLNWVHNQPDSEIVAYAASEDIPARKFIHDNADHYGFRSY